MSQSPTPVRTRNNLYQHLKVVKESREKRHHYKKCFVEGVGAINLALKHEWRFNMIAYDAARPLSAWARGILEAAAPEETVALSTELMSELSDKDAASELLALVEQRSASISELQPREAGLIMVLDRPSSPGNLGTTIRTADGLGADALIMSGHGVDPFDPHVVRSSVGTLFALTPIVVPSHREIAAWCDASKSAGLPYRIIGTSSQAKRPIYESALTAPVVMVLGNETVGMSRAYQELCDEIVTIPIQGAASSLNVSAAASIVLYEVVRQRVGAKIGSR